jgi:hypothetical protein
MYARKVGRGAARGFGASGRLREGLFFRLAFLEDAFRLRRVFKASNKRAVAPGVETGMALIRAGLAD